MYGTFVAILFSGAALFSAVVIAQMVRGYLPLMRAALRHDPLPRTYVPATSVYVTRSRRRIGAPMFAAAKPRRLAPARAAA